MPAKFNLTRMVADLLQSRALRQSFNRRPLQLMNAYNLDATERCILYSMHPPTLAQHLAPPVDTQVQNFNIPAGEFSPESENCLPDPPAAAPQYPSPIPSLFRVRPRIIDPAIHVINGFYELIVYGQTFSRNPNAMVRIVDANGGRTDGQATFIFGSMRCSRMRAVFPYVPGTFELRLFNCAGMPAEHEAVNHLTLQVN